MGLKPNESILAGLATGGASIGVFSLMMPSATDIKQVEPFNRDVDGTRRTATFIALGIAGAVSLLTRDSGPFIIGGGVGVAISLAYAHADAVSPITGKVATAVKGGLSSVPGQVSEEAPDTGALYVDEQVA